MRQAIFLWWLGLLFIVVFSLPKVVFAQIPDTPYEYETSCWRIVYNKGIGTEGDLINAYSYHPSSSVNAPQYSSQTPRDNANLNFSAAARGFACGEVQSEPIKLKETVGYNAPPWNACTVIAGYAGEITFNYGTMQNFWIPFAQELANDWAGTMDTEHLSVSDYDNLVSRSQGKVNNVLGIVDLSDQIAAQNEINQRNGVLRKLLTMDQQDTLKCNFANWAAKNHNQHKPTMYAPNASGEPYYAPDDKIMLPLLGGAACRNVACPLTSSDPNYKRGECLTAYDNGTILVYEPNHGGYYAPGPAWQKMGLIPNEKSRGNIKMFVCGDRQYDQITYYPEVFRMGLAANELFKIFSDKSTQDQFYVGENQYLKDNPLDALLKMSILAGAPSPQTISSNDLFPAAVSAVPNDPVKTSQDTSVQLGKTNKEIPSPGQKILGLIKFLWPKVQKAFAQTIEKNNDVKKIRVLLAQAQSQPTVNCGPSDPVFQVTVDNTKNSDNTYSATVNISRTACGVQELPGLLGHVRLYQDVSGLAGTPHDFFFPNCDKANCPTVTLNSDMIPLVLPTFKSIEELQQWLDSGILNIRADYFGIDPTSINGKGITLIYRVRGGNSNFLGSKCDVDKSCCVTGFGCVDTCMTCGKTQFGPSESSIYSSGYPHSHLIVGTKNYAAVTQADIDPIVNSFKPTLSDCTFTPDKDQYDQYTACSSGCGSSESCGPGDVCGSWSCQRTTERVVNVFNNVPFLGSVWRQVADPQFGFMAAIKPQSIVGTNSIPSDFSGCSTDESMILDQYGNFVPEHAASYMQWGFRQFNEFDVKKDPADSINVTLDQDPAKNSKVLFYRLAGVCNASKWFAEKVLNPLLKSGLTANGLQQNQGLIQTCALKGVTDIQVSKYYDSQCNESSMPQAGFIQGVTILQGSP